MNPTAMTKAFIKQAFKQNPHYSFNDWTVMYNHSLLVEKIALKISHYVPSSKLLLSLGALLHDIGKTYLADHDILHKDHEKFNLRVCENFLVSLKLPYLQLQQLKRIVSYTDNSVEMRIIQDADALALYMDKKLYMLYIDWACRNNLELAIKRKINKFSKLHYSISQEIGRSSFKQMVFDWD